MALPLLIAGQAGASLVGGLIAAQQQKAAERANAARLAAIDAQLYGNLSAPELQFLQTSYNDLSPDAQSVSAQRMALQRLQELANAGGLTMEDRATLAQIQQEQEQVARGSREALLQNARQRGQMSSGQLLGAQLQADQNAAQEAKMRGLQVGSMAQRRALEALMGSANLAGDIRSQGFNEQSRVAAARDAINQFNQAQRQQRFGNEMALAGQRGNLLTNQASAQRQADLVGPRSTAAVFGGVGDALTSYGMYDAAQKAQAAQDAQRFTQAGNSPLRSYSVK